MLTIKNTDKIYGHRLSDDWVFGKVVLHRWDYYFYINDTDGNQCKDIRLHRHPIREDTYRIHYGSHHIDMAKEAIEDIELFSFYVSVLIGPD